MALVLPAINGSGQPESVANSSRVCRPSSPFLRLPQIGSRSVVSAEPSPVRFFARRSPRRTCLDLRAHRSLLIARTLLTGSDIAAC
jgi:hypothetical protein